MNRRFDHWNDYPREHERDLFERGYRPYEPYRHLPPGQRRFRPHPDDYLRTGERIPAWDEHPWNPEARSPGPGLLGRILRNRRGPKGYKRSDERIREDIHEQLINEIYIDASEVSIQVKDGEALLDGTVPDRRMKYAIEDIAANCHGVRDVHNRIRVARPSMDLTPDRPREFGGYGTH